MVAFKTFNTCKCIRPSDRNGRILESCDSAVHKIGKGTGARHRKQGPRRLFLRGSVFGLTASLGLPTLTERLLCRIKIPHPRAKLRQICHMQIKLPTESVCARLAQLVRSLTSNKKVPGSILRLVEG